MYEGHADNSGIQRHSIGDQYPLVSVVQMRGNKKTWTLLDARTSFEVVGIPSREMLDWFVAHVLILKLRIDRMFNWVEFTHFCVKASV